MLPAEPRIAALAPYLVQETPLDSVGTPVPLQANADALLDGSAGPLAGAALLLTGTYLVASERDRRRQPRLA